MSYGGTQLADSACSAHLVVDRWGFFVANDIGGKHGSGPTLSATGGNFCVIPAGGKHASRLTLFSDRRGLLAGDRRMNKTCSDYGSKYHGGKVLVGPPCLRTGGDYFDAGVMAASSLVASPCLRTGGDYFDTKLR